MTENSWKDSIESFASHLDPERDQELKGTKIEIDEKVTKIMKLIKNKNKDRKDGNLRRDSQLVEFIQDFHKQYQSLYSLYDNLRGEVRDKVHDRKKKEGSSSPTPSSDSESYYSPDEIGGKTSPSKSGLNKAKDNFKQKLETSNLEVADMRNKLTSMGEEKEALNSKYMASLNKIQESEKIIKGLRIEAEQTACIKQKLLDESSQLKEKLVEREKELLSLTKRHQVHGSEASARITELESQVTSMKLELENLTEKLASSTLHEQRTLEEKEGLRLQVKDLDSLRSQKSELEEQIRGKNHEANQLRVEKEGLNARMLAVEKSQVERLEGLDYDASAQIEALREQINSLQQELDSLHTEKLQIEREKQESSESLTQLEQQMMELTSKISDQERTLKGQDDVINKLNEENRQDKDRLLDSKLSLQTAERKIEEMAEEMRKKFEDSLRLLSRRIRVAEQLHVENKDFYRKTREMYEKEHTDLKERIATNQVVVRRINDITPTANDVLSGLDPVALKFQECSGNFLNRISKVSCELKFAKDWVRRKNNAMKHVKEDVDCLLAQLDVKEAEILGFREKVWKLETKVRELEKMVKEKEEGMLGLGEEKREAIRQLCVWIDYHRSRSDYLKKMLSEMTARSQRTP
uniref:Putative intracellular protein transport protein USO1-like n=1 Tax=Davidia involucrata TaxID=16924 RepID=A0A5B6YSV3_DAVIN